MGMNDYVTKPIDPGLLFSALVKWIKPRPRGLSPQTDVPNVFHGAGRDGVLPELAGVDVPSGLRRIGGNVSGYKALLA